MENLKKTWGRIQGIPFAKGYFRKVSSPPKKNLAKEKRYPFEDFLKDMFGQENMTPDLSTVIDVRNHIIHEGVSMLPPGLFEPCYCMQHKRTKLYRFLIAEA